MKIILNDCIDTIEAVRMAERFINEFPADHKACGFVGGGFGTYVKRTFAGNLSVTQWRQVSPDQEQI